MDCNLNRRKISCIKMSTVQRVLLVLTVQALLGFVHGNVVLNTVEAASRFHSNIIRLSCVGGEEGDVSFHSRVGQTTSVVTLDDGVPVTSTDLTFQITPETEGEYYCEVAGEQSNSVTFVAYPHSDSTIRRVYTARLGETMEMQCTIPVGALRDRYSVQWYKGINTITNSTREEFNHISVNENSGALVFSGVKASDASKGYFCAMTVEMIDEPDVRRQGSTIALHVSAPLHMTRPLSIRSMAAAVGAEVSFTCQASGIPAPEFRWSLNGSQYSNGVTTTNEVRTATVCVTSTLVLPSVVEEHTGTVMCVAFHENISSTVVATSSANLIVLTNNFEVDLTFQDGQVVVRGMLPVFIVGFFSLQVRFYSTERVPREEEIVIPLADTSSIDIVIPREKLPSFRRFSVAVAIGSNSRYGQLTEKTNPIDLRESSLGPCDCLSTSAGSGGGDSIVVPVISVLVVLVVVGIIVLLAIGGLIYYRKSMPGKATSEFSVTHGSIRNSASRCSYASQGSRHSSRSSRSSRSKTYGSESGASDCSTNVELKVTTKDELRDVRNYETIDHKMLEQWEEKQFGKNQLDGHGSCKNVVPPMRVDAGHAPVFHTHIGIPNPHPVPRQALRDSQSSFEDLEDECLEFSTEVPRSY